MASGDLAAKAVIAFDVCLGFTAQDQRLRGIKGRPANHLAVDQPVLQVQHVRLGRHTLCEGEFHGGQHGLLIVV